MKRKLGRLLSTGLLICFSVFIVPGELLHSFFGHEDTHHLIGYPSGQCALDERHVHCPLLTYDCSPYLNTELQFLRINRDHLFIREVVSPVVANSVSPEITFLRGPPLN